MPNSVYLDYAAATPLDARVLKAMHPYLHDNFYNPTATYSAGQAARQALETARAGVAHWLGARPSEIVFTAGGSEANNLAIHGVMRQFSAANLVVSSVEHESVLMPAKRYDCRQAQVAVDGRLDLDKAVQKIDTQTVLVSVMYANNEVGTIQPIRQLAQLMTAIRKQRQKNGNKLPLYMHVDACQAGNYLDLHVARLGVDLLTINGGKMYGPKQSGALYIKGGIQLQPLIDGGGQESGLRSGTQNVAGAVGLACALTIAQAERQTESSRLQKLQQQFLDFVVQRIPMATINGSLHHRLPNNVHFTIPDQDNERLLIKLDEAGIMAAAGSACSASDQEPSHVLRALGLSDNEARASLRFTMGRSTTLAEIDLAVKILASL